MIEVDDLITTYSDLQNISSNDFNARKALANEIRDVCINVGFFYSQYPTSTTVRGSTNPRTVKNHGIPETVIADALVAGKKFFKLPQADKSAIDIHKSSNFKGYTGLLGENTNPENRGDLHEGFDLGWEDDSGSTRAGDGAMTGQNVWPDGMQLPGFKEAVMKY